MGKQSINLTPSNQEWLDGKIANAEYMTKTNAVNDLIRREREEKLATLKAVIEHGPASGISDESLDSIRDNVLNKMASYRLSKNASTDIHHLHSDGILRFGQRQAEAI